MSHWYVNGHVVVGVIGSGLRINFQIRYGNVDLARIVVDCSLGHLISDLSIGGRVD